jgi:hypothetical protein
MVRAQDFGSAQSSTADKSTVDSGSGADPKSEQLMLLLETLFKLKRITRVDLHATASQQQQLSLTQSQQISQSATAADGRSESGFSYDDQQTYAESEKMALSMAGTLTTDDGRQFSFSYEYRMERTLVQQRSTQIRAGSAAVQDPLVLDVGGVTGQPGGLSGVTTPFDLHGNGGQDRLPVPAAGWRYLVQGAQSPVNGSALFGPRSGQGFAELAAMDVDGNGFVDAGDPGFTDLHLWDGVHTPEPLAKYGIGALAVRSVTAPFRFAGADGITQGQNQRSGMYVTDQGRVGAMHQIDVAV